MYTTKRYFLRYGNEDDVVDVTTKEFEDFEKALRYARRYTTGRRFLSVEILDDNDNMLYEFVAGVGEEFLNQKKEMGNMKKEVYTTNAEGMEFTVQEVLNFLYNADNIGNCEECPYNDGYERGAAYIVGPCGQQNCWVSVHNYEEDGEDD